MIQNLEPAYKDPNIQQTLRNGLADMAAHNTQYNIESPPGYASSFLQKPGNAKRAANVSSQIDQDLWSGKLQAIALHQDRRAFAELFTFFAPRIKAFILNGSAGRNGGVINQELAEEIVQEVLLKVWNKAATYNPKQANVSTWIYTIARNCRIDFLRKHNFEECSLDVDDIWEEQPSEETPLQNLQQQRTKKYIEEKMRMLPDDQRQVLFKSFMEGKSHQEISQDLNISLGTVKSRVRLAMQKLSLLTDK